MIAVQVLDTAGNPMAGVRVVAEQEHGGTMFLAAEATSDANGRAEFAVRGRSSGYDVIRFRAATVSAAMDIRVSPIGSTAPAKPTANLSDYDTVSAGTQLVITAQEGAVIRYTTDNTCPCTDAALTYTGPITLTESGFYRIAAWTQAGGYSERLNLHITVTGSSSGDHTPTYGVTAGKTANGSVSVSPKYASKGDTVTVTVIPDKGYVLESLTVLDWNGNELTLTDKGDGKYTFTMPAGKVEVKAAFMEDGAMLNHFVDVKVNGYYYDAVLWAVRNGITNGISATEFGPNLSCTRAQIVTLLWRAAGSPEPKGTDSFADVKSGSYYEKAVLWAVENGITAGVGDGKFDPNAACTREQAVAFLYRASGSPAVSGGSAFGDVAENAYYADAVAWAEKNEITGGIGGGLFGSGNDCTRGQIVTLLYRAYSK